MVRLSDLHEAEAQHLQARADAMQRIEPGVWITPKPLAESKVAIVSTAGLHLRSDAPFTLGALDYRVVPSNADWADVGEIGGVSTWHYSFMGAMPAPQLFEDTGTEVGQLLAADDVDVALLVPV